MGKKIKFIKFVYRLGAVIDLYFVVALAVPSLWAFTFNIDSFQPDISERLAIMTGASLMLGWTILLLWADRKPVERKFILLLTFFPVVICFLALIVFDLYFTSTLFWNLGLIFIKLLILSVLLLTAYVFASSIEKEKKIADKNKN